MLTLQPRSKREVQAVDDLHELSRFPRAQILEFWEYTLLQASLAYLEDKVLTIPFIGEIKIKVIPAETPGGKPQTVFWFTPSDTLKDQVESMNAGGTDAIMRTLINKIAYEALDKVEKYQAPKKKKPKKMKDDATPIDFRNIQESLSAVIDASPAVSSADYTADSSGDDEEDESWDDEDDDEDVEDSEDSEDVDAEDALYNSYDPVVGGQ